LISCSRRRQRADAVAHDREIDGFKHRFLGRRIDVAGGARSPGESPIEGGTMTSSSETGQVTGTKDKTYNIIWFTEACLSNTLRLETYIQDAERDGDTELAEFFRRAQAESRKGADQGKQLLRARLGS
jgi:hypothetical protein